ncbi:MAG: hypothetical protein H7Z37_16640 [Pyrinomonadaceae bacterium]|nr:hypothetical protein [Pyrinomonadaceae bacterium]
MEKDAEHLKILSICYYVAAGFIALFACFPLIHFFIGIAMLTGSFAGAFPDNGKEQPPFALVGGVFVIIALFIITIGWAIAIATFYAGKSIKQRKNYIFCLVMAGILCTSFPVGTVLGVFTFLVLLRDSVKPLFNNGASSNPNQFGGKPESWR